MDGIRDSKDDGTYTYEYLNQNGQVVRQTKKNQSGGVESTIDFIYDEQSRPRAMVYNGVTYLYVLSLQGDVIRIISKTGETKAEYTYDAWGKVLSETGTLAAVNPLRYRGYYYDTETGLYYLQSRYYDPVVKRFINADGYASTGQGFLGYNMFAYCGNDPVNRLDVDGRDAGAITAGVAGATWWLALIDGPLPIGDIVLGAIVCAAFIIELEETSREGTVSPPDVTYPGDDPAKAPDGYSWTGPDAQGGTRGGYKNNDPNKKDSWHPDLNNEKEGPHWDYNDGNGHKWRIYPDGRISLAKAKAVGTIVKTKRVYRRRTKCARPKRVQRGRMHMERM